MKTKSNVQELSMQAIESFFRQNKAGVLSLSDGGKGVEDEMIEFEA